ncbi:MAG: UvrD-helicase domain-containing protein [Vicinamibacterales bacterium]
MSKGTGPLRPSDTPPRVRSISIGEAGATQQDLLAAVQLHDQPARDRIVADLRTNLLVEAGAGSGKTQKLAERMAAGVATGAYELECMAAVTFTRKAAAELRGRFQAALESERERTTDPARLTRIEHALGNLERFFAGTIHAFCARLLRERPIEAGVAPGFTELDDAEEALLRQRSWRDYRSQARAIGDPDVMELLDAGMTAKQLDRAFETVCVYEDVTFPAGHVPMPDAGPVWAATAHFWQTLHAMLPTTVDAASTCKTQERCARFQRLWRAHQGGRHDLPLLAELLKIWQSKPAVVQMYWERGVGKRASDLHGEFRDTTVLPFLTAWRQYLYGRCIALLIKGRDAARDERRRRNVLSFNDLLLTTAAVLRSNPEVRHALQQKYRWLLVDEFQDTDPVQAEIMFLLAADETRASAASGQVESDQKDWRTVALRPGALFVVGDPKQSIYRFRRADIEIYNDVRERLRGAEGEGIVRLTANFRSVSGLCEWANTVFAGVFPAEPTPQSPMFAPLEPAREAAAAPAIAVLDLADVGDPRRVSTEEADRVARYIRGEVDAGRRAFGDFLILTRKKKGLRPYAAALEVLHVPIEVTGAGAFDNSDEVRELALLLIALADPQDAVALVGVLRGRLFGLSDRALFDFRQAGGYFNLFCTTPDRTAPPADDAMAVAAALEQLRTWHGWTRMLPAGAALERILADSGYLALAATSRGGVEAGDLLHAVDRVRAVVETGFTIAEAAEALAAWSGLDDEGVKESTEVDSLPLEPGRHDVVRLMNVHKAKGLEADVVFLVDPHGGYPSTADIRIVRDGADARGYFQIVEETESFGKKVLAEPPGWADHAAAEGLFLDAELERLMYVAATRAKDLLVVGVCPPSGKYKPAWPTLTKHLATAPKLAVPAAVTAPVADTVDLSRTAADVALAASEAAHTNARHPSWQATSVTSEIKRLPKFTIDVADEDDPTRTVVPNTPSHRADAGQAWGTLVHGLLEHAMRYPHATTDDLRRLALWLIVDEPPLRTVIDQAVATAQAVCASDALAAARVAVERHEEIPFAVARADRGQPPVVVSGTIDLAYRTGDEWRIVDYKTDVDTAATAASATYDAQVKAYSDAWERVTRAVVTTTVVPARD